jgi:NAD(P)H-nitrite reductase large subunit
MEDIEIYHCNNIMKSEIVTAIKVKSLKTVEEVQVETAVGTVWGSCIPDIEDVLKEANT